MKWTHMTDRINQGRSQGGRGVPCLPIEMLFQIFRLKFRWYISKIQHYFSNKFSKINIVWNSVIWPICGFSS